MLPYGLRARRDYLAFRFRHYWPFYLSAIGLVLGVLSAIATQVPGSFLGPVVAGLTIVGYLVGTLTFRKEWQAHRERSKRFEWTPVHGPTIRAQPPGSCKGSRMVMHPILGEAVADDASAAALDDPDRLVEWLPDEFDLGDELRGTAVQVIGRRLKDGVIAYNGPAVRLVSDLCFPLPAQISMQGATYFDGECSNELARWQIQDRQGVDEFAARYILDREGRLRGLGASLLANIIGVSTVALTSDGQLIVLGQSNRSGASPGLLAPSGSGSLEPRDLPTRSLPTFREFVVTGMERELREECHFDTEVRAVTHLTGSARWVARSGKPELFGVTVLPDTKAEDIAGGEARRSERVFHNRIETYDLDLQALSSLDLAAGLDSLPGVPKEVKDSSSMPLLLALRALGHRLADGWRLPCPRASPAPSAPS
jgi:hypothetical protein